MKRGARYGRSNTLRWTLTREWGDGPTLCYIGHNPSTATHEVEDPTTLAWHHFAASNGFGRYVAVNLYPYRSADVTRCRQWANWDRGSPEWSIRDDINENIAIVAREAKAAHMVVASWGAIAQDSDHVDAIIEAVQCGEAPHPNIYCLGLTASGAPKHPMARGKHRIPRGQQFILWRAA